MMLFFPFPGPAQTKRSKLQTGEVRVRFRVPDLQPQPDQRVQPRACHLSLPRRAEEVRHLEHELRVRRLQVRLVQRPRRQGRKHGQVSSGSYSIPALFLSIVISLILLSFVVSSAHKTFKSHCYLCSFCGSRVVASRANFGPGFNSCSLQTF